jgi:hypothetical protein
MKISAKVYWFIQKKVNSSLTTKLMLAAMAALVLYLLLAGKLFKDLNVTHYF